MCYNVFIATDSPEDLASFASELLLPKKLERGVCDVKNIDKLLTVPFIWELGSQSGCGCEFRHLMTENVESLGFAEPEEWFEESPEQIEGTRQIYRMIHAILKQGWSVELADFWYDSDATEAIKLEVSLSKVSEAQFRLFESHLFTIKP